MIAEKHKTERVTKMTQSITVTVNAWNGEKQMGLDEYVQQFVETAGELIYVLDIDAETRQEDYDYLNEVKAWTKRKAVQKFMALYTAQNA